MENTDLPDYYSLFIMIWTPIVLGLVIAFVLSYVRKYKKKQRERNECKHPTWEYTEMADLNNIHFHDVVCTNCKRSLAEINN